MTNVYDDSSIRVLEGLEAVREKPGMYIGSTDITGLHHLIWEVLDNSVDECVSGAATEITLTIEADHIVTIHDNGRGIPTGINTQTGLSNIVTIFTKLHAGGKFGGSIYKISGGLHGVGVKCVNALSTFFEVRVWREGKEHYSRFINGGQLEIAPHVVSNEAGERSGTEIRWQPDFTVLEKNEYDVDLIKERLERLSYLNKKVKFIFQSKITGEAHTYYSEEGLGDWIRKINSNVQRIHEIINIKSEDREIVKRGKQEFLKFEASFQYSSDREKEVIYSFCNNIYTSLGGAHLEGVKEGLLSCIRTYALENRIIKNMFEIVKEDILGGLSLILSIYYTNPTYRGQTKEVLNNTEIKSIIKDEVDRLFHIYLQENVEDRKAILAHIEKEYYLRLQREKVRELNRNIKRENSLEFAEKLADCTIKNPEFSELYIVEGDSAGGSAKSARNREFQAILPLKGKLINVEKRSGILGNDEIKNLISAIGCSHSSAFDLSKLKYNKVILMTDADVDGAHIRVLLLTFLYRYMKPLLENNHVYIAQPPLYKASSNREVVYLFDEREREEFISSRNKNLSFEISRFKGLGEMSPVQLWETTMNPQTRTFLSVKLEEDERTESAIIKLMGKKVRPRKEFIIQNYFKARLDI